VAKESLSPVRRSRRIGYVSAATAGSSAGTRHDYLQWALSSDIVLGGWTFTSRFAISDANAVANARLFVGMINRSSALPNGNPSALLNLVGIGCDAGETELSIMHNSDSGAATKYDLGEDFPANTRNDDLYELKLTAAANGTSIAWFVKRVGTAHEQSGSISTDLPMPHALLAPHHWRNNGSTAAAVGLDILHWSLEATH